MNVHTHTPNLLAHDPRTLPVRKVAYLRTVAGGAVERLVTRQGHNLAGHLTEQWDPRLFGTAPKANLAKVYALSGQPLQVDSVDAGWRLSLPGLAGEERQRWDQRGDHWQTDYDDQLRVVALHEQPAGQAQTLVEHFTYADGEADPAYNLRGRMITQQDPSGTLTLDSFGLLGQPRQETRTFLDGQPYTTTWHYSATGQLLTQTDAAGHRQHSRFDVAGQLKENLLQLKAAAQAQPIVHDIHYNAAGQIEAQTAGNGVVSRWTYDPADARLSTLTAQKPGDPLRQDLRYFYDRVGNVLRIEDHTLATVYVANQRVDGHRAFSYDSLYRLIRATGFEADTPNLQPGLPAPAEPIDPGRRFNYTQHYEYDTGNNLIELRHVRDGHNYTQRMRIDPHSNRGVRWAEGDPEPIFDEHFDAHGNQLKQQPGTLPLVWNSRDQLAVTCLVERDNAANDEETYTYSQGVRVEKKLITQAQSVNHTRTVRYLHGLEIRTLDNSEALHVIILPGNIRCLHWVTGKPAGIDNDQLRYSLDDHLGSCTLELDDEGALISLEFYYPFGGTCWWAARSVVEASYKTVRYSGKEMDVSGLYYYGARYYAAWLQRWVSADPAGAVDGLNVYAFVGNNPVIYIDSNGRVKSGFWEQATNILGTTADVGSKVHDVATDFDGPDDEASVTPEIRKNMTFRKFLFSKRGWAAFGVGASVGGTLGGVAGTFAPGVGNAVGGLIGGLVGGVLAAYVRYRFFKKDIRIAEALNTAKIRDVTRDISDGANDLASGKLPESLQNKLDEVRENAMTSIVEEVSQWSPLKQLDFSDLMKEGKTMAQAYRSLIETVKDVPTEAGKMLEEVKDRATELRDSASGLGQQVVLELNDEGMFERYEDIKQSVEQVKALGSHLSQRPIPKPRTRRGLETSA